MPTTTSLVPSFTLKVLLPSIGAVGGIALLLVHIVNAIFEEMNRMDSAYTEKLAAGAVSSLRDHLEAVVYDNTVWDDAVRNAGTEINLQWADEMWSVGSGSDVYDAAFIVDPDGKTIHGSIKGERSSLTAEEYFGPEIRTLLGRISTTRAEWQVKSGILPAKGGISTVGVGRITPTTPGLVSLDQKINRLILAKVIDGKVLATIARGYAMDNLAFASRDKAPGEGSIRIFSPSGTRIANLIWSDRSPGNLLRDKFGRVVSIVLAMFLFVIAVLLYMSWRGFKEAHDSQAEAIAASLRDDLTGLANRRELLAVLTRRLATARADQSPLSVVYADLDGFKEVNDSYGHEIGDMLLRATAAGFSYLGRDADVIARLGGDEFAMIMTGADSARKARETAQSMIAFLQEPMVFDGRIASVSVSVGIVDFEAGDADVEEMIRRADVAMYAAKAEGRNRVHVFQKSLDFKRDTNRTIARQLREHISQGNLTVVYQPIVDARTRRTKGVEALVRWPKDSPVRHSPDVFIPVAEEFGLIEDLGHFVLTQACRQAAQWRGIFVAVNVSPIQFMNPNFADLVESTLAATGLDATRLEVEVTEGFIIDNAARANAIINRLHEMHVRVALDDFGTGFSSIGHLRRFKFDKLKLDRSMVTDILRQPSALRLVQGTIAMADALGLTVVAEGIEDENQVSVLRLAGCALFQGYLFSRPVEAHEIKAFLEDAREALAS